MLSGAEQTGRRPMFQGSGYELLNNHISAVTVRTYSVFV